MAVLSPSILAADISKLGEQVKAVENAGGKDIHIDVMDGVLVPSLSFGFPVVESLRPVSGLFFDVHLMIVEPERYIERFAAAGSDAISVHVEACKDVNAVLDLIESTGKKPGLALHPETKIEEVFPYLDRLDRVIVMTVRTGFGGQKYMDECTPKITGLREEINKRGLETHIAVDGGVTLENAGMIVNAGADIIVSGSSVFNGDIEKNVREFNGILT